MNAPGSHWLILCRCTSSICFTQWTHHVDSLEGTEKGMFLYYPLSAFCDALSLSLYLIRPPHCGLEVCVHSLNTGFLAKWKFLQLHFKGRVKGREGRRGFWQDGAVCGICPLALGTAQMGSAVCQRLNCMFWREKEAYELVSLFSLDFNIYLFVLPSFPRPSLPSAAKLMASCQNLLMHLLCRFKLSNILAKPVCKHLGNICLPSHKRLWVAGKVNKSNWL